MAKHKPQLLTGTNRRRSRAQEAGWPGKHPRGPSRLVAATGRVSRRTAQVPSSESGALAAEASPGLIPAAGEMELKASTQQ